jgi:uncharacterized protein (TIGR01777 family)
VRTAKSSSFPEALLRIGITGSHGLIGSALVAALEENGHVVTRIVRRAPLSGAQEVHWNPESEFIEEGALARLDAVVNLAGENLASGRWTASRMSRIRNSRVDGTLLLSRTLARQKEPPQVLLSASATGYYGSRADKVLTENSLNGSGFLADVCREWEEATQAAAKSSIRVVTLRFAMVLSPQGGALAKMLRPFQLGLGGPVGTGKQYWSWISLDDAVEAIQFSLNSTLSGPLNLSAPVPVTNREFAGTLAAVLGRKSRFAAPALALRVLLGEMAEEMLLASARVLPAKLTEAGFRFRHPELRVALDHLLAARPAPN